MLRRLYGCAVQLHPAAFRERFADEMLSIFDQQTSKSAQATLVADGFLSLLRQWTLRHVFWPRLSVVQSQAAPDGIPTFYMISPFRPRRTAVVHGILVTTAIFCLTCFAIRYSWIHVLHVGIRESRSEPSPWIAPTPVHADSHDRSSQPAPEDQGAFAPPSTTATSTSSSSTKNETALADLSGMKQTQATTSDLNRDFSVQGFHPTAVGAQSPAADSQSPYGAGLPAAIDDSFQFDQAERHRVIMGADAKLNQYYIDAEVAKKMSDTLLSHERKGDDDAVGDPEAFAALLTAQLQSASHDRYVEVIYATQPVVEVRRVPTPIEIAEYRRQMMKNNCTFEKVEILQHNIGYLKFNSFPDVSICGSIAAAAMRKLNGADAIIFDLRDNPGGYANMVALIATYLFNHRTHLNDFYERGRDLTEESWTNTPIPGNKLANKPVFILTSSTTFSAAEAFSYDLKMLKRATLVGETTSGRGHMGGLHRIDDRFAMRIPGIKVVNPISKSNWEGTGIEPDVKVKAADALDTAEKLARAGSTNK